MRDRRLARFEGRRGRTLVEGLGSRPVRILAHKLNQRLHRHPGWHRAVVQAELDTCHRVALIARRDALQCSACSTQVVSLEHGVQRFGSVLSIVRHDFAAYQARNTAAKAPGLISVPFRARAPYPQTPEMLTLSYASAANCAGPGHFSAAARGRTRPAHGKLPPKRLRLSARPQGPSILVRFDDEGQSGPRPGQ